MKLSPNWNREGGGDRTEEYRRWRNECGFGAVSDVDQLEYQFATGRPSVVVELCVADRASADIPAGVPEHATAPSRAFFEGCERKVSPERGQGRVLRHLARTFEVPILLVCYIRGELESGGVWVKEVDSDRYWEHYTLEHWKLTLRRLDRRA